jgi:hypothetical protein
MTVSSYGKKQELMGFGAVPREGHATTRVSFERGERLQRLGHFFRQHMGQLRPGEYDHRVFVEFVVGDTIYGADTSEEIGQNTMQSGEPYVLHNSQEDEITLAMLATDTPGMCLTFVNGSPAFPVVAPVEGLKQFWPGTHILRPRLSL